MDFPSLFLVAHSHFNLMVRSFRSTPVVQHIASPRYLHQGSVAYARRADPEYQAELKGSIGEGPNHSNHSNHSNSFKIGIFRNFSLENSKISENFNIF